MRQGHRSGIEAHVIEAVSASASGLPAWIAIGPGDDMALIAPDACRHGVLAACDQVVEGRHFTRDTPLALVGRKAVARNVSDVAAMAAEPLATLASCVLPRRIGVDGAQSLLESVRRHAEHWGAPLIGGDTAVHDDPDGPLMLCVTILARPRIAPRGDPIRVVRRHGAMPGDALYVTGSCGGSLGPGGLGRHLHFEPRLAASHALVDALGDALHAMIDVSDGLGIDAGRIASASGGSVVARIDGPRVPRTAGSSLDAALSDGEDHELLFAVDPGVKVPESLPDGQGGSVPCTRIGDIAPRLPSMPDARAVLAVPGDAALQDISRRGWMHE
jgi:thiamine-monophosphate kinase